VKGEATQRLHHLDALRALAMILILPTHALALLGLQRSLNDPEAAVVWLIHVFRLPLFFLVAGFFGALLLRARGVSALLRNRLVRIGLPMVIVVLVVAPVLVLCFNEIANGAYRPASTGLEAFTHLRPSYVWFLWYLLLLYPFALLLQAVLSRHARARDLVQRGGKRLLAHWGAPLLLGLPSAALLYWQPLWIAGAPTDSFVPRADLFAYYGLFFVCGWLLFATPGLRDAIELRPQRYALLVVLALPLALTLYLFQSEASVGSSRWLHVLALVSLCVSTWALIFCLLGLTRRFLPAANPRVRYWADASYWIYLSHFPLMAAIAVAILGVTMPGALKVAFLVAATLLLIYPAYGAFVRHTPIGRILHGPRQRPRQSPAGLEALQRSAA